MRARRAARPELGEQAAQPMRKGHNQRRCSAARGAAALPDACVGEERGAVLVRGHVERGAEAGAIGKGVLGEGSSGADSAEDLSVGACGGVRFGWRQHAKVVNVT
jgi:hypothetical protein